MVGTAQRRQVVNIISESSAELGRALHVAKALHRAGISAGLSSSNDAAVTITVGADRLTAVTPSGTTEMTALDDVVGLLVQLK
jgi:hypothetical protein